nr:plant PDR ABC transporter associated [Tanacetum cinerariifolium]
MVGDQTRRGISGGEKKRVTTGEMLVGPANVFFTDEISTGLDSSTTFRITKFLKQMVHLMDLTMVISVLQPDPETYKLFDDLRLCIKAFKSFHIGQELDKEMQIPYDKSKTHPDALVKEKFGQQFLAFFAIHQMALSLFRLIAAVGRTEVLSNSLGALILFLVVNLGGFVVAMALGDAKRVIREENDIKNSNFGSRKEDFEEEEWPLSLAFNHVDYYIDTPIEMKHSGFKENRLQMLKNVSGAFRPGILTALVGVSGAGKTTLMDVLAGRKTGGYTEGDIFISGYPKNQSTFARVSGYCEQNDIHSPNVTVHESLLFSAWLRLSADVNANTRKIFVDELMELVEFHPLRNSMVGLRGVDGLTIEQRKRLTIAVELVANPSIIFM